MASNDENAGVHLAKRAIKTFAAGGFLIIWSALMLIYLIMVGSEVKWLYLVGIGLLLSGIGLIALIFISGKIGHEAKEAAQQSETEPDKGSTHRI